MADIRLSVVVPTVGRPTLCRTLRSIVDAGFRAGQDELIVVSDGPSPDAKKILDFYAKLLPAVYVEGPLTKMVGQVQKNVGIAKATGTHVLVMDDDDQYTHGALRKIRATIAQSPNRLYLFKMLTASNRHSYGHCWRSKDIVLGNVGTPMLVSPNIPARLGKFGNHYGGDFDYVRSTVNLHPAGEKGLVWVDEIICYVY